MDRNHLYAASGVDFAEVALRKESVDRNNSPHSQKNINRGSLSARRAWIEIALVVSACNFFSSLSARRAWIEICGGVFARLLAAWSLSARRAWIEIGRALR